MRNEETVRRAWLELEPRLRDVGYELVEVEFAGQGSRGVLRLYIDKADGITLDDCQAVSQMLGPVLDETDFIEGSYYLEVSSPGVDRPVRKPEDFARFAGERIAAKAVMPVDGRKQFKGVLRGYRDGSVLIESEDGQVHEIHAENLLKAKLDR